MANSSKTRTQDYLSFKKGLKFLFNIKKTFFLLKNISKNSWRFCASSWEIIFFLIGIIGNFFTLLLHNITLAAVFLMVIFLKVIFSLTFKKDSLRMKKESWIFDNSFEDWVLVFSPFISAGYYGDFTLLTGLFVFWLVFILSLNNVSLMQFWTRLFKR